MSNGGTAYRVSYSQAQIQQIAQWLTQAQTTESRVARQDLLLGVEHQITTRPTEWGDPFRDLTHWNLTMCRGVRDPIVVLYAVDEARRIVYVSEIRLPPVSNLDNGA